MSQSEPSPPPDAGGPSPQEIAAQIAAQSGRLSARTRLRNYFLTGIVVAGPLALTASIVWWVIGLVDGWVKPFIPTAYWPDTYLPVSLPGFGLIVSLVGLTLLGFLTANLVGRTLVEFGEMILERMPVVRGLYRGIKQVFETLFTPSGTSFRKVGLVQFPTPGTWSIVFLSASPAKEIVGPLPPEPGEYVGVFLPCTPNPTTGFFFYLPRRDVIEVSISVDEAAKLVMSAGLIQPDEQQRRLQTLAGQRPADAAAEGSRPAP